MINRHNHNIINLEKKIQFAHELLDADLEMCAKKEVRNLSSLSGECINALFLQLYDEEQGAKHKDKFRWTKREYLELALKAKLAYYDLVMHPGEELKVELAGVSYTFIGSETKRDIGNGSWMGLWNLAHIIGDKNAINFLLKIPESFLRTDNLKGDEYRFLIIDFLKSLYLSPSEIHKKLETAYEATDPLVLKVEEPVYVLNNTVPLLDIYTAILSNEEQLFNSSIEEALKCRKYMITRGKHENRIEVLYNFDVLSACIIGVQKGLKITVESPYIPRELYMG